MQRLQAFKYELRPDAAQQRRMRRFAGSCRFVFNKALALQKANYEAGGPFIGYVRMAKHLTAWRHDPQTPWLSEAPCHPLQHALRDLEKAYQNFFARRTDFPRFKRKGVGDRLRYPDPKQIKLDQANSRVFLPKPGWLSYRNSRQVLGEVRNLTVLGQAGRWFVSIQTQRQVVDPVHSSQTAIGIDLGVTRFATLSDGSFIAPLNSFKKHRQRLANAQRAMARKRKFSNNWRKEKTKVQRIYVRIGNARRDFLHKTSTTISQNHAIVCLEDLRVLDMSRSAAGSADTPGRNVRAKSGLNRGILDQGWGEFRRQLEYNQAWRGGQVLAVPPRNTSRSCPICTHVSAHNRLNQTRFSCVNCGFEQNADVVGALNVLAAEHAVLACGGTVRMGRPVKQEPAEVSQAA